MKIYLVLDILFVLLWFLISPQYLRIYSIYSLASASIKERNIVNYKLHVYIGLGDSTHQIFIGCVSNSPNLPHSKQGREGRKRVYISAKNVSKVKGEHKKNHLREGIKKSKC